MAISTNIQQLEKGKFKESSATAGQPGIVIVNPDGSNVGGTISGALPAGSNIIGKVGIDTTTPGTTNSVATITGQDGVAGGTGVDEATVQRMSLATDIPLPAGTNALGTITASLDTSAIMNDTTPLTPKYAVINATTNGDNTIIAAVAGKKLRVLSYTLVTDEAVGVAFEDGAGGSEISGQMAFAANGGTSVSFSPVGHFETTANTLLNIETDAVANVRGHICYIEV